MTNQDQQSRDEQNKIEAYIRRNFMTYNRKAIEDNLLRSGYTRQAINAAWDAVFPPRPASALGPMPPLPPDLEPEQGNIVNLYLALFAMLAIPALMMSSSGAQVQCNVLFIVTEFLLLIGIAPLAKQGWRHKDILALCLVVNFVWLFIVTGLCVLNVIH